MYNRIVFGGSLSQFFSVNIPDLNKREYTILGTLVAFTLFFGIFPSVILNGLHYSVSTLIYSYNSEIFAILPSLSATSISGLSNIKPNPYFITGFADASTKYLVVFGSNLQSTVGSRFTRTQLAMVRLASYQYSVIIGLILSDG
jgi:hypothetical protein